MLRRHYIPLKSIKQKYTHREGFQEDQTLYDALHRVSRQTECASQVTSSAADGRRRDDGRYEGAAGARAPRAVVTVSCSRSSSVQCRHKTL
jgi:ribosomal protein L19E